MRSLLVPSCMNLLHDARELESPFLLGCKPAMPGYDRSRVLRDPPSASGFRAQLWWELVFLRLGAQTSKAERLKLPKGIFTSRNISTDLNKVLDVYEAREDLAELRRRCEIEDRSGQVRRADQRLMGPKFEQFLGPEFAVEAFQSADLVALAQRLLDLSIEPSGPEVLSWLCRAAKRAATLQAAYKFVAEAWQKDPACMAPAILQTKATGIWLLDDSNQIVLKKTADACWEDVKKLFPPWKWRKSLTSLQDFFVAGLGLAATFIVQEMVVTPTTAATPVAEAAQSSELKAGKPPKRKHQDLPGLLPMRSPMALNTDATEAPREKGTKRKLEAECAAEAPSSCQKQNAGGVASAETKTERPFTQCEGSVPSCPFRRRERERVLNDMV